MNRLSTAERAQIISLLVEGNSLRSTSRITGRSINTVSKLLVDIGAACSEFQDRTIRNLTSTRIECDEIWAFCYSKASNVPEEHKGDWGYGDVWTWTAIDSDTKLIPSWLVGWRGEEEAVDFLMDLRGRLANRVQLTTPRIMSQRSRSTPCITTSRECTRALRTPISALPQWLRVSRITSGPARRSRDCWTRVEAG